jgi:predicted glycosyltransferase
VDEGFLKNDKPDYIIILPWNLKEEITEQLNYIKTWDAKFVTAIPRLEIF